MRLWKLSHVALSLSVIATQSSFSGCSQTTGGDQYPKQAEETPAPTQAIQAPVLSGIDEAIAGQDPTDQQICAFLSYHAQAIPFEYAQLCQAGLLSKLRSSQEGKANEIARDVKVTVFKLTLGGTYSSAGPEALKQLFTLSDLYCRDPESYMTTFGRDTIFKDIDVMETSNHTTAAQSGQCDVSIKTRSYFGIYGAHEAKQVYRVNRAGNIMTTVNYLTRTVKQTKQATTVGLTFADKGITRVVSMQTSSADAVVNIAVDTALTKVRSGYEQGMARTRQLLP
ncbi:MAG: hypothetical protein RIQ81_556 [Pseudomonadota bacterium]|jgi:hypothetical protein